MYPWGEGHLLGRGLVSRHLLHARAATSVRTGSLITNPLDVLQGPEGAGWGVLRRTLPDVLKVLSPTKGAASAEPWVVAGHSVAQDASALADMVRQTRELLRQGL